MEKAIAISEGSWSASSHSKLAVEKEADFVDAEIDRRLLNIGERIGVRHLEVVKELLKYSNKETITGKSQLEFDTLHIAANQGHDAQCTRDQGCPLRGIHEVNK